MGQPHRITSDVYLVGSSNLSSPGDCMVYLVNCESDLVLIDTGVNPDIHAICQNIQHLGFAPSMLSTVFLTHCHIDHIGGAASFRQIFGCTVIMHMLDSASVEQADSELTGASLYHSTLIPCPIDTKLQGSTGYVTVGTHRFQWFHTPGHTPGSISILLPTLQGTVLFAQDVHGPFMPQFRSSITDWRQSMQRLIHLDFDILAEGHFGVFQPKTQAVDYITSYLKHYNQL